MATVKQTKKSAAGGKRGKAVGAVRKRKVAKGSAGGGAGSGTTLDDRTITFNNKSFIGWKNGGAGGVSGNCAGESGIGHIALDRLDWDAISSHVEQALGAAEGGLQARVPSWADSGEPERADKPAEGGQQAGSVPDAGGSDAAYEMLTKPDDWWSYHARGLHRASSLGVTGVAGRWFARGYADGGAFENRETARRTRTAIGAALLIGAAAGAVLLAIAQGLLRG